MSDEQRAAFEAWARTREGFKPNLLRGCGGYQDDETIALYDCWCDAVAEQAAELARLREVIKSIHKQLYDLPELNMANYTEDQVSQLNDGVCDVVRWIENMLAAETAKEESET
jgi:hypothetical protein